MSMQDYFTIYRTWLSFVKLVNGSLGMLVQVTK